MALGWSWGCVIAGWVHENELNWKTLTLIYMPLITTIPLHQGMTWSPTWKALPTSKLTVEKLTSRAAKARKIRSSFVSLPYELASFQLLLVYVHAQAEQWSQACLWQERVRYLFDDNKRVFTGDDLDWFERRIGPRLPDLLLKRLLRRHISQADWVLVLSWGRGGVNTRLVKWFWSWISQVSRLLFNHFWRDGKKSVVKYPKGWIRLSFLRWEARLGQLARKKSQLQPLVDSELMLECEIEEEEEKSPEGENKLLENLLLLALQEVHRG